MIDISLIIKNYPNILKVFTQEWFEKEITKDKNEMHLLAKQFTFTSQDGSSLDSHSLQYIDYLEKLLKDMKDEINSKKKHFKRIAEKNSFLSTLAEIEIGYFLKNMDFKVEFEPSISGKKSDIKIVSDGLEIFIEVSIRRGPEIEDIYMFSWDDIPGKDNDKLIHYLEHIYDVDLEETGTIEKIDNCNTIKISAEKNFLVLKLNDEKNKVTLKTDDGRMDEFIAKIGNGKLNVYENSTRIGKIKFQQPSIYREKLSTESNQLSKSNPGIIALYLDPSSIPERNNIYRGFGFDRLWEKNGTIVHIEEGEHIMDKSMISAILLYINYFDNKHNIVKELCLNPKADNQLPDLLLTKFRDSGTKIIKPVEYNE